MSRTETSRLERKSETTFEFEGISGSITGAWKVGEPETFEEGVAEGAWTYKNPNIEKAKWKDDEQGNLFRPEGNPRGMELAEVKFTRNMKIRDVLRWLESYNTEARKRGMPTYALGNRFQLLAWRRGTKGDAAQEQDKIMIAGGSSTRVLGTRLMPYFYGFKAERYLDLAWDAYEWAAGCSFLLVRTN